MIYRLNSISTLSVEIIFFQSKLHEWHRFLIYTFSRNYILPKDGMTINAELIYTFSRNYILPKERLWITRSAIYTFSRNYILPKISKQKSISLIYTFSRNYILPKSSSSVKFALSTLSVEIIFFQRVMDFDHNLVNLHFQ